MNLKSLLRGAAFVGLTAAASGSALAQPGAAPAAAHSLLGVNCDAPPAWHCPDDACLSSWVTQPGDTVEMKSRRPYFLDCPTGYTAGDKVSILLSLHGGGSYANWQRNYFPAMDVKDKHKLVIITPGAPTRAWSAADDQYLMDIVDSVVGAVGKANVDRFILAGHSQGGATSSRIICTPYFRDKVDVRISLSGGRIGTAAPATRGTAFPVGQTVAAYDPDNPAPARAGGRGGAPGAPGAAPARGGVPGRGAAAAPNTAAAGGALAAAGRGGAPGRGAAPAGPPGGDCDYSFIYASGEFESNSPTTSPLAEKYGCSARVQRPDVVDPKKGYVWDATRQDPGTDQWGHYPRSGRSQVYQWPGCRDGRVIADVIKLGKGHTEGYEPNITDEMMRMAVSAAGGKIKNGSWSPPAPAGRGGAPGGLPGRGGAPGGGRGGPPGRGG